MRSVTRLITLGFALLLCLAGPASAQYLRITTDNPGDPTRLRATGTTILTITLDTNHDRNGSLQSCNSHTAASCGSAATSQPLDMFSYTLALKAVGGTVTWGTFTAADAAYTDTSPQIQSDTEVEINKARPVGTVTAPGLATLGSIPVTPITVTPHIDVQIGASGINPFGFGTGFGTDCDGFLFPNTYVVGDPSDPCGNTTGITGDWFDWDGAGPAALPNNPPALDPIANMTIGVGGCAPATADQAIRAIDPDAQTITFTSTGPTFMTVTSNPQVGNARTGNIHLTSPTNASGTFAASVTASDGVGGSDTKSFTIQTVVVNQAPVLAQPSNMIVPAPLTADQPLSGSDPCGAPLTFTMASGPSFMTVTTQSATTGNIHLAPITTDQGIYSATVRATNSGGLSDTKAFTITVTHADFAPVLAQPSNMTVNEGATADQTLTATHQNGNAMTFSKVSGPAFVTVTTSNPGNGTATGNIHLAPGFTDSGTYGVTVRASDGSLSDSKSFTITVNDVNRPPTLNQPANMTVTEGATADQILSATDPDGNALVFSKQAGPSFMFVTTINPSTGNAHLAPGFTDAGAYSATVRASDGSLFSDRTFTIAVCNLNRPPVLAQPANMTVTAGATADQTLTATNPDGLPMSFTMVGGPAYVIVTTTSPGSGIATGNVHAAPGANDVGAATVTIQASTAQTGPCGGGATDRKSFTITVTPAGNRCPTSIPGGPYSGITGAPVTFDGSESSDPDGNPLTYAWDFDASDGITVDAVGTMAMHTYPVAGSFTVTLTVTDNGGGDPAHVCSHSATTTATIQDACDATVFNGYDTIRLGSGRPFWFAYVQPQGTCYSNSDVVIPSFVMKYAGRQISAVGKTAIGGDKSGDGIQEIKISFAKDDLRTLFTGTGLGNGHNTVTVTLEANLATGGRLSGTTQLDVVNNGSFNVAVSPNPLNPQATLSWTTSKAGFARIEMFDIHGRLVRRLVDETAVAAGEHKATIDGRDQRGVSLPSGVYFIRGSLAEGEFRQIITILK